MNRFAEYWSLDSSIDYLNHGSFGACPIAVLEHQQRLRGELERQPVEFFLRRLPELLDEAREKVAGFLGADPANLAPVPNATTGVNAVLHSLELSPGDQLLTTDHEYNACRNALDHVAMRAGAEVLVVQVPFPVESEGQVGDAIMDAVTPRTVLALIDHVTSPTGMILPVESLVRDLDERGVDTLVDGAHGPGMLDLDLESLGAAYYVGNCHKWLCAPKGAGILHVRPDRRERVRPVTISHGANTRRPGRSLFHDEFDWTGTDDPTPFLSVPASMEHIGSMVEGGWDDVRSRNHALVLEARDILATALEIPHPCPDSMIGSMAALPLPDGSPDNQGAPPDEDRLQAALIGKHNIEVVVSRWPAPPRRCLRVSAQLYNQTEQYVRLAEALRTELGEQT